jgi:hypothetical protein
MSLPYPGISATFDFKKPDDIQGSMTITMSIKQWKHIADVLSTDKYEEWPLRAAIMDLVRQANIVLYPKREDA